MLRLVDVAAGYGGVEILHGVNLELVEGGLVAVLGRNGMGKSTMVAAIAGWIPKNHGTVMFDGYDITTLGPTAIARRGISLVPQGRHIFPNLSVQAHLQLGWRGRGAPWTPDAVFELFPSLASRARQLAKTLSGGEQQMLVIARALLGNPSLLILDEPSEGLAPSVVALVVDTLHKLRASGISVLLVEQSLDMAIELADRVCVLEDGVVTYHADKSRFSDELGSLRRSLAI